MVGKGGGRGKRVRGRETPEQGTRGEKRRGDRRREGKGRVRKFSRQERRGAKEDKEGKRSKPVREEGAGDVKGCIGNAK